MKLIGNRNIKVSQYTDAHWQFLAHHCTSKAFCYTTKNSMQMACKQWTMCVNNKFTTLSQYHIGTLGSPPDFRFPRHKVCFGCAKRLKICIAKLIKIHGKSQISIKIEDFYTINRKQTKKIQQQL